MAESNKLKSALSRMPREKAGERLSPGVYRGAKGNLVTQAGRQIQRPPQAPQAPQAPTPQSNLLLTNPPVSQNQWPDSQSQVWWGNIPQGGQFGSQYGNIGAQLANLQQMPQPSANMGGQYRLSPGVYGNREQAMQQYNQALQQYNVSPANAYKQG
jgi:hypothetical protein